MLDTISSHAHCGRGPSRRNYVVNVVARMGHWRGVLRRVYVATVVEARGTEREEFVFPAGVGGERLKDVPTKAVKAFDKYLADKRKESRR